MIGQYLSNNNETAIVAFRQKFCQLSSLLFPLSIKTCNYGLRVQKKSNSRLTKFIVNNIHIYAPNQFIIKIYFIINLMIFI
jgi:hypothetical protein